MSLIVVLGLFLLCLPPIVILSGYTLSTLWGWFVVPLFSLPALTIPYAIGLMIVVTFVFHKKQDSDSDEVSKLVSTEDYTKFLIDKIVYVLVFNAMTLGIGWVVTKFI